MQKFRKKRELLEYLGKNPNDNKLVDRMILRGEVHMENGMYIYESKDEVIEGLKKEIKNLKEEQGNNTLSSNSEELYEAKVQWEYYQNLYENEVKDKQNRIRKCFQWIKAKYPKAEWDEFRDWVMWD